VLALRPPRTPGRVRSAIGGSAARRACSATSAFSTTRLQNGCRKIEPERFRGFEVCSPADFGKHIADEWAKVIRAANIKAECQASQGDIP
jgi:hypothetical protein